MSATIKDAEGRKINGYKIRQDENGYFINRFKMRGCLELKRYESTDGVVMFEWLQVTHYENHKEKVAA